MKKLITFALALVCGMGCVVFAQEKSQHVVTLQHGENIQTFYGTGAFKDAYDAADNGDVITLPTQTFDAFDIEKAITIRGSHNDSLITNIVGEFRFNVTDSLANRLNVEGLNFVNDISINAKNSVFSKCKMQNRATLLSNVTIVNCHVFWVYLNNNTENTFLNSYIVNLGDHYRENVTSSASFFNCNILDVSYGGSAYCLPNLAFQNCILCCDYGYWGESGIFPATVIAQNCVTAYDRMFENINSANGTLNNSIADWNTLFKDGTFFELTDDAKKTYIGTDGTEVGIYGGMHPYNETLSNPTITSFDVTKRVAQGETLKINVGIK